MASVLKARGVYVQMKLAFMLLVFLSLTMCVDAKKKKKTPACSVCKDIVKNFSKGLEDTNKSNFGGGNTNWEEKSLGSYAYSETRLVEIMENLCNDAAKECHSMLEAYEEDVERYWFKEFAQKKDTDLHSYLCIDHIKACCPENTYGAECSECPGGVKRPCSGNGKCDGEGTREGSGTCKCNSGYKGDLCQECKDGYFEEAKNESHITCKVCHISCKNTCWEAGPKGCDECKDGWTANEELKCQDINECVDEPCEELQYCTNTQGSYTCFSCNDACLGCTGSGPGACKECASGYVLNEETKKCTDVNECDEDPSLCSGQHQLCRNEPGSYKCDCNKGYNLKDGQCVPAPKDKEEEEKEAANKEDEKNKEKEEL